MKILFTGGGTAGHVTPNIALIDELYSQHDCYYIGTDGMEKQLLSPLVASGKLKYYQLQAPKLNRKLSLKTLAVPLQLVKAIRASKKYLLEIMPDVVFGKGGYVSLPVAISASKLNIPVIMHESDSSMGLANKIAYRYCSKMLSAFPNTRHCQHVGAILSKKLYAGSRNKGLKSMSLSGSKPVLLVMGGSLGAGQINGLISNSQELSKTYDIFVITGKNKSINCPFVKQAQFVSNMSDIYAASSVAITRAGANSLTELVATNIPFVTIPLTENSRGEQLHNAMYFSDLCCGIMLTGEVTSRQLIDSVNYINENYNYYQTCQRNMQLDGTDKVIDIILNAPKANL